jgi:hypothetical protein
MVVIISQLQPDLGLKQFGQSVENLAIVVLGLFIRSQEFFQGGRRA